MGNFLSLLFAPSMLTIHRERVAVIADEIRAIRAHTAQQESTLAGLRQQHSAALQRVDQLRDGNTHLRVCLHREEAVHANNQIDAIVRIAWALAA